MFAARETKRTIVLASTSGGSGGDAGAGVASTSTAGLHGPFDAAIVLGDLAARTAAPAARGPLLRRLRLGAAGRSSGPSPPRSRSETGWDPGAPSTLGQLAHLAFPLAVGEQGVARRPGLPAVLVQAAGERGPAPARGAEHRTARRARPRGAHRGRRARHRARRPAGDCRRAWCSQRKTMPEWALRLLAAARCCSAPLIAGADGLARLRRRREPVGRWTLWTLSCALPFLGCALFCWLLGQLGVIGAAPSVPGSAARRCPSTPPPTRPSARVALIFAARLAAVGGAGCDAWGSPARPDADVAGLPVLLVCCRVAVVAWVGNPYTALLLRAGAAPVAAAGRARAAPAAGVGSSRSCCLALRPRAAVAFYAHQLGLGAGERAPGSAVLLLAGGHVGLGSALLWSLALRLRARRARCSPSRRRRASRPRRSASGVEITIRGPLSYAGPGSLGGTESALRR